MKAKDAQLLAQIARELQTSVAQALLDPRTSNHHVKAIQRINAKQLRGLRYKVLVWTSCLAGGISAGAVVGALTHFYWHLW